jgi:UDP-2,3-diacylglucosamine pyrophosphatase LpxH
MAGNHDHLEWGGRVLEEDARVKLFDDPVVMEIAGRRPLITHGDTPARKMLLYLAACRRRIGLHPRHPVRVG